MNVPTRSGWLSSPMVVVAIAAAVAITACDRPTPRAADTSPPSAAAPAAPTSPPQISATDGANNGARGAEGADANAEPMKPMTKEEESTSMPQPGQANDHSTLAKDTKS